MVRKDFIGMDDRLWTEGEWAAWVRYLEKPGKADMKSLIHLYAGFAMCCDGEKTMRVNLTNEQIVQLASDACEQAAKILRWEARHEQSSKDRPDAAGGNL